MPNGDEKSNNQNWMYTIPVLIVVILILICLCKYMKKAEIHSKHKPSVKSKKNKGKIRDDEDTISTPLMKQQPKAIATKRKPVKDEPKQTKPKPKPKPKPKFATRDVQGNIRVQGRHYNLTDNPVTIHGQCLWNILRNHGVSNEILQAAAQAIGINVDDYVDVNQLQNLFNRINDKLRATYLDTIGFRLDVINYTDGDIVGGENFTHNTNANLVLGIGLLVDQEGIGHYVEDRNSFLSTQVKQNFHGNKKAKEKYKKQAKREVKRKEKEEEEKRQAEFIEREKIRKEQERIENERRDERRQHYKILEKTDGEKIKKNISGYCSTSTKIAKSLLEKYPTAPNIIKNIDSFVRMYFWYQAYNWNVEEMRKDKIFASDMKSRHFANRDEFGNRLIPNQQGGDEYDAAVPEFYGIRGFFRFIRFSDGTVYFTRDHYLTFINMETGEVIESPAYQEKKKKK